MVCRQGKRLSAKKDSISASGNSGRPPCLPARKWSVLWYGLRACISACTLRVGANSSRSILRQAQDERVAGERFKRIIPAKTNPPLGPAAFPPSRKRTLCSDLQAVPPAKPQLPVWAILVIAPRTSCHSHTSTRRTQQPPASLPAGNAY